MLCRSSSEPVLQQAKLRKMHASGDYTIAVLLRVYAKCIAGQDEEARRRVDEALTAKSEPPTRSE